MEDFWKTKSEHNRYVPLQGLKAPPQSLSFNLQQDTSCTEADPALGWEGSSTSIISQRWQIGYFLSQVIVSGWVIYDFCDSSLTWPQVSQIPLRTQAAVFTLFFPPLASVSNARVMHSSLKDRVVPYVCRHWEYWSSIWIFLVFILQLSVFVWGCPFIVLRLTSLNSCSYLRDKLLWRVCRIYDGRANQKRLSKTII